MSFSFLGSAEPVRELPDYSGFTHRRSLHEVQLQKKKKPKNQRTQSDRSLNDPAPTCPEIFLK
ncbi:hypothetical protein A2974_01435 [Candidatus Peregrinibacteria bacterium RIFCSPLOWO2_01_FULL_48_20]|nr:MAG: hypothetical protein A2974_01435 [Candidatus Peregrinibacteria bacterium RIFCSPLOWO2_01_FULL_48_20]